MAEAGQSRTFRSFTSSRCASPSFLARLSSTGASMLVGCVRVVRSSSALTDRCWALVSARCPGQVPNAGGE
eukprot:34116-Pyramimonas_sp.AAC.1